MRQTRFVIHKLDLKDCHAVISIMRVSHYILNDVELPLLRMELYGCYRGYKKVKEERVVHFLGAGLELIWDHYLKFFLFTLF